MKNSDIIEKQKPLTGSKYSIVTYGCQMNEHESQKLAGMLEKLGGAAVDGGEEADVVVFNTCCVRENAELKVFGNVGRLKRLKRERPDMIIIVCGCMTQQEEVAQRLGKTYPFVDIIIGTHNLHTLPGLIEECLEGRRKKSCIEVWESEGSVIEDIPIKRDGGVAASVNVMYGCNNFCSYCIVPYVRGRERSRSAANIIEEINVLCGAGKQEILLLGQNVNSYGKGTDTDFPDLLSLICRETDIKRIRFMTSHPKDLSAKLIETIARFPQICNHIHLPVQSGSTNVLERMNRRYTREGYLSLVGNIRSVIPDIALTTDIIVGFPGETERDFEDTLSLVEKVRYDAAFTFVYSVRQGTKAAQMSGQIDEETKKDRITRLVALQNRITEEKDKAYEGSVQRVLVESVSARDKSHVCGRAECGKTVNFAGESALIGSFCDVRITKGKKTTLFGELERTRL